MKNFDSIDWAFIKELASCGCRECLGEIYMECKQ